MSYLDKEASVQDALPVELYEFTSASQYWRYTSAPYAISYLEREYTPSSITRSSITQTTDIFKGSITFTFPKSNLFASQYLAFSPDNVTTVTVYRGHVTDLADEYIVYWKGRVVGAKTNGNSIEIECESVFTSIRRVGLRARFEYGCRHSLYQKGCNVSKELYKHSGAITSITNEMQLQVTGANLQPDGYYIGGLLNTPLGVSRFITNHVGDVITISRPIQGLLSTTVVDIFPGCDHLKETCKDKFNNLNNFGGFPWVPNKNPYGGSSIV